MADRSKSTEKKDLEKSRDEEIEKEVEKRIRERDEEANTQYVFFIAIFFLAMLGICELFMENIILALLSFAFLIVDLVCVLKKEKVVLRTVFAILSFVFIVIFMIITGINPATMF